MKPETVSRRVGRKARRIWAALGALLAVAAVVAAVALFTQPAPSVPATGLTPNCQSPAQLTASKTLVTIGTTGDLSFNCGASAAFHAVASSQTPTFTLGSPYTDLYVFPHTNAIAGTCATTTGALQLTSGASFTFSGTNDWDYCADYGSVGSGGLPAFSVSWTAP